MHKITMVCLAAGLGLATACSAKRGPGHPGDGPHVQQDRQVSEFSSVELAGAFEADVQIGTPQRVTLEGELEFVQDIETVVEGDALLVRWPAGNIKGNGVRVTIVTPALDSLEVSGASSLGIGGLRGKAFALRVSGASTARLDGEVQALRAEINGTGALDSTNLLAQSVAVEVNGSGRADVTALAELTAAIHGAGRIRYRGEPKVESSVHGAGRVRPF